ncbi:MAG: hypothetical protein AABM43_00835 [Actinomycetota bacterium]
MAMTTNSSLGGKTASPNGQRSRRGTVVVSKRWMAAVASVVASAALCFVLAFASSADAYIYWSDAGGYPSPEVGIGRAELSGQNEIKNFIPNVQPFKVEVGGGRIYWTGFGGTPWIGSANIDGTGATDQFAHIDTVPGDTYYPVPPNGVDVAVGGGYFYWLGHRPFAGPGPFYIRSGYTIGRARLDGSGAEQNLISADESGAMEGSGLTPWAIAADEGHVYWLYEINDYSYPTSPDQLVIGRANLDGTGVVTHFIDVGTLEIHGAGGLAVDAAHIYWVETYLDTIGRANLDGSGVNRQFTQTPANEPNIAVDAQHLYWSGIAPPQHQGRVIGRANLDGSGVNTAFLDPTGGSVNGLAVDGLVGAPGGKCQGKRATIVGTAGKDKLKGTKKADVIVGLGGKDKIIAKGGNDIVCAGAGNDKVFGGVGNDKLNGEGGNDRLLGGKGKDKLKGGKGKDKLYGGPGLDKLNGGPGKDIQKQ